MVKGIIFYFISVFFSSCAQILLKKSAINPHKSLLKEYMNVKVISAYTTLLCATWITIYAYRFIPLSTGAVLEVSGYVFVTILSYFFLDEKIARKTVIGIFLIIVGILLFNIN